MRYTYIPALLMLLCISCKKEEINTPANNNIQQEDPTVVNTSILTQGDSMLLGVWVRDGQIRGMIDTAGDTVYIDQAAQWPKCHWDDEFTYAANKRLYVNFNKDTCHPHHLDIDSFSKWELMNNNTMIKYTDSRDSSGIVYKLDSFSTTSFIIVDERNLPGRGFLNRYKYRKK